MNTPMAYDELLTKKGYVITNSDISDWEKDNFTATKDGSFLFCIAGSANVVINLMEYTLSPNSYMAIPGDSIVKLVSKTDDFEVMRLVYAPDTILSATTGINMDTMQNIFTHPCNTVKDERSVPIIKNLLNTLKVYAEMPNYPHHTDFTFGIIRILFVTIADVNAMANKDNSQSVVFTTTDSYFINFIKLLNKHCCQQHDVAFYADKLSITPKYLNEIARKTANLTAKDIISKFIVARIKRELLISGNSVQRIAYDFNFCDQSSLGKFFKKATGMSPVAFRRSHS